MKKQQNLMPCKQAIGTYTYRVTVPKAWVGALGGENTKRVDCYKLSAGMLVVRAGAVIDEKAIKDIDNILYVAADDKPVTFLRLR